MTLLALLSLAIWLYLVIARGFFWRGAERLPRLSCPRQGEGNAPAAWPSVTAIIPARNEAEVVAANVGSLLRQNYPGRFRVILVDDGSGDGTAEIALNAAIEAGALSRLHVLRGTEPQAGWTGKLWAMRGGLAGEQASADPAEFILFTDADIAYESIDALRILVEAALARDAVLTSLMVKLRCDSAAERALVPAFVYFFAMLYPFAWVNDARRATAAAAGGCMLVRRTALEAAGGLDVIRSALIDDCALAAAMKRQGPIWLGLTDQVVSLRPYPAFGDIRRMVSRSAYAELRYAPARLAGAVLGLALTYLAPPLVAILAEGPARWIALVVWALMALSFQPTLRLYRRNPLWGVALPAIAAVYTGFTLDSAVQHWRGRGGAWKGRYQAARA